LRSAANPILADTPSRFLFYLTRCFASPDRIKAYRFSLCLSSAFSAFLCFRILTP